MPKLTLEQIDDGIAALRGVKRYLQHILDDDGQTYNWKGRNKLIVNDLVSMLIQSHSLRRELDPSSDTLDQDDE
jgi:hypothetical protein